MRRRATSARTVSSLGVGMPYPRQNPIARALREIGRVERPLFMLDWLDDADLSRRANANLNKGEAHNALARAVFFVAAFAEIIRGSFSQP